MNKYQEALSSILFTLHLRVKPKILGNCEDENLEVLQELVDSQEKIETIIKEYEIKLGNLKEYTQGHSLLNGLICDLKELVKGNENE